MKTEIIFDNKTAVILYWLANVVLFLALITLLYLYFNDMVLIPRTYFVLIIGVHLAFVFWFSLYYVCIKIDEQQRLIIIDYLKRFNFRWKKQLIHVEIPFDEYGGLDYNSGFTAGISFFKIENDQKYILGPLSLGFMFPGRMKKIDSRLKAAAGLSSDQH